MTTPHAEVSFILDGQRRRAWFHVEPDQDTKRMEADLLSALDALRRDHGADMVGACLMDVGVNPWMVPESATLGGARDLMDFLLETVNGGVEPPIQALYRLADAVDRERHERLNDPNRAHASGEAASGIVMAAFNWRTPDGGDFGQTNFFNALPQSAHVGAFLGEMSNWLVATGLGYDLSYTALPLSPAHASFAQACAALGEALDETSISDPDVDLVAVDWARALREVGDRWRTAPLPRKVRPRSA